MDLLGNLQSNSISALNQSAVSGIDTSKSSVSEQTSDSGADSSFSEIVNQYVSSDETQTDTNTNTNNVSSDNSSSLITSSISDTTSTTLNEAATISADTGNSAEGDSNNQSQDYLLSNNQNSSNTPTSDSETTDTSANTTASTATEGEAEQHAGSEAVTNTEKSQNTANKETKTSNDESLNLAAIIGSLNAGQNINNMINDESDDVADGTITSADLNVEQSIASASAILTQSENTSEIAAANIVNAQKEATNKNLSSDNNVTSTDDGSLINSDDIVKVDQISGNSLIKDDAQKGHSNNNFATLINAQLNGQSDSTSTNAGDTNAAALLNANSTDSTNASSATSQATGTYQLSSDNINAIAAIMVRKYNNGQQTFTIRLDPPELGEINVELKVDKDKKVKASISASNQDTLNDLNKSVKELTQNLKDSGLDISEEDFEFTLNNNSGGNSYTNSNSESEENNNYAKQNQNNSVNISENINQLTEIQTADTYQSWRNLRVSLIA